MSRHYGSNGPSPPYVTAERHCRTCGRALREVLCSCTAHDRPITVQCNCTVHTRRTAQTNSNMAWLSPAAVGAGAIIVFLAVILLLWRLSTNTKRKSTVPGLQPSSDQYGNMSDISKAGSLHQFLMELHKKYGPIASFWWNTEYTVSIASAEVFKEHQHIFDRPVNQFKVFEPLLTPNSIQYANGEDGKARKFTYDKLFSHEALDVYYDKLQKIADDVANKWSKAEADDHFPLGEHMFLFAVKGALVALLGDRFKDDEEALAFKRSYDEVWKEIIVNSDSSELPAEGSERAENLKQALGIMKKIVARAVEEREEHGSKSRDFLLIDAIIGQHTDEERRFGDAISYTVGGFHTTGNLLTWCIYYLCLNEEVQEKLYKEILDVLGPKEKVTHQSIGQLKYTRQVLDESLRCAVVGPFAARVSNEDMTIAGYNVPAGTPVIHALGVALKDEKVWPAPDVFDPDRFSAKNSSGRPALAFSPYGFAGRRVCPGYRFAYVEATILVVTMLQKFKIHLVPGQTVEPVYGFVTHPKEEIWVKVTKRA